MNYVAAAQTPRSITLTYTDTATAQAETCTFDEFISEKIIRQRIRAMARCLAPLLAAAPRQTVAVPILAGATQTMDAILLSASEYQPSISPSIAPVKLRSYDGTKPGALIMEQDVPAGTFTGKRVFVFDEVVDRGYTMHHVIEKRIKPEKPEKIIVVTLVRKPAALQVPVQTDVVGFGVAADFLLGWGMDWRGQGRWLPWIGRLHDSTHAAYTMPLLPIFK